MAYWVDEKKVGHEDTSVRLVTFRDGSTAHIANDVDSPASMFCLTCDGFVRPIIRIAIIDKEQWDYAEGAETECPECGESDLYSDEYDARAEQDARALDRYNDYLFEARRDARLFGE